MTHLDLFSGIGGFALAAQWNGLKTVGFSEVDDYAVKILKQHWPDVTNYGDITKTSMRQLRGTIDLLTGGFPCQPYSLAGKRGGSSDDRALWPQMRRIINQVRPRWVLAENVPGIIGMELDRVLSQMEAIGYTCGTLVIPACAVDARHRRDRVWIVAHAAQGGVRCGCAPRETGQPAFSGEALADNLRNRSTAGVANQTGRQKGNPTESFDGCSTIPNPERNQRNQGRSSTPRQASQWWPPSQLGGCRWVEEAESGVLRVADGIPNRSHRLRALGNAIVPQVAAQIIKAMIEIETLK